MDIKIIYGILPIFFAIFVYYTVLYKEVQVVETNMVEQGLCLNKNQ